MHQEEDDPRAPVAWADDQLGASMRGNEACVQCHAMEPEQVVAHTHHELGSSGSECMNCHMPYTTYGLLKACRQYTSNPATRLNYATT